MYSNYFIILISLFKKNMEEFDVTLIVGEAIVVVVVVVVVGIMRLGIWCGIFIMHYLKSWHFFPFKLSDNEMESILLG